MPRAIEVTFPEEITISKKAYRLLHDVIDMICRDYVAAHPGRVMWAAVGMGQRIVSMPWTAQDDEDGVPMVFDDTTESIECAERADHDWPCALCEFKQGDHKDCIASPPAGDCPFEPTAPAIEAAPESPPGPLNPPI